MLTVTVTRSGGFTGDVAVTVEGLPAGVTASALTIVAAASSGVVTLTAVAAANVAGSNLTVRAAGAGVSSATAALALNVRAAAATGAVSVTFSPTSLTIIQGATVNVTATITRTGGFTGPVTLAVTGAPAGLTVVITPTASANQTATVTSSSANLAFTAATVAVGAYNIGISASGTGVTTNSVNFSTTVNPPVAGTGNATFTFCPASGIPVGVWQQDGATAAWTKVNAGANNTFPVNITQSKGGVAYEYSPATNSYQLNVVYGTQAELQQQGTSICANQGQTAKSVTGTITGVTAPDNATIALGSAVASPASGTSAYTLSNVPNGSLDLVASKTALTISGSSVTSALTNLVIRRNQNFAAGAVISPIDLSATSAEAFAPVNKTLTITGLNGEQAIAGMTYVTANGTNIGLYNDAISSSTAATRQFPTLPANKTQAGDYHLLFVTASSTSSAVTTFRTRGQYFFAGADRTLGLSPNPNTVTVSNLNFAAPVRLRAQTVSLAEYDKYFLVQYQQGGNAPRSVSVTYTTAYLTTAASGQNAGAAATSNLNGGTTLNLDVPDLGPTYTASWGLQPLTLTTVLTGFYGWNTSTGGAGPQVSESSSYSFAFRQFSYTP